MGVALQCPLRRRPNIVRLNANSPYAYELTAKMIINKI